MNAAVRMRPEVLLVVSLLGVAGPACSQALDDVDASPQVRSMAASCAACHGTDGHAVEGEAMVALAGYPRESLVAQMQAFRDGRRSATVMHQIARGYSDRQIESLAAYFAAQSAKPR